MAIGVTVLRVFTDRHGQFGNPLGVVDAGTVQPADRARLAAQLGYSETVFVDLPTAGSATARARIYTPLTELPFAGHPVLGVAWWLRERGVPIRTLQVPAGLVQVSYQGDRAAVTARSEWAPAFAMHQLDSVAELAAADPVDYSDDAQHYLWAWADEAAGSVRSRAFCGGLGVAEDEATGSAAMRITDFLSRDLTITQGNGSIIQTTWSPDGWVRVTGRTVDDGVMQLV